MAGKDRQDPGRDRVIPEKPASAPPWVADAGSKLDVRGSRFEASNMRLHPFDVPLRDQWIAPAKNNSPSARPAREQTPRSRPGACSTLASRRLAGDARQRASAHLRVERAAVVVLVARHQRARAEPAALRAFGAQVVFGIGVGDLLRFGLLRLIDELASAAGSFSGWCRRPAPCRPPTTLATDLLGDEVDQLAGLDLAGQVGVTPAIRLTLPSLTVASTMTALFSLSLSLSRSRAAPWRRRLPACGQHLGALDLRGLAARIVALAGGQLALQAASSFSSAFTLSSMPAARATSCGCAFSKAAASRAGLLNSCTKAVRVGAGDRFDTAHAGRDAGLRNDLEQADVAGALTWVPPHSSFELPMRARAPRRRTSRRTASSRRSSGVLDRPSPRASRGGVGEDLAFTMRSTRRISSPSPAGVRKVEARLVGIDQRALLLHVRRPALRAAPCASGGWPSGCARARGPGCRHGPRRCRPR
jgi:hypothetical protein